MEGLDEIGRSGENGRVFANGNARETGEERVVSEPRFVPGETVEELRLLSRGSFSDVIANCSSHWLSTSAVAGRSVWRRHESGRVPCPGRFVVNESLPRDKLHVMIWGASRQLKCT